ncbi:EVE domain-containing protein [Herpetosiphon gulosus]|uniref:EVE domain-containing protein n=1 Tax=Herpetosiphon gulosus TaxID=1973496 RepID=A0ABP9X840_9CHLR
MSPTSPPSVPPVTQNTWIFQAHPSLYRINEALKIEPKELWNINQHAKKVRRGDRALIWISGDHAGIYAIGTVQHDPIMQPDSDIGQAYWIDKRRGQAVKPRVEVVYDRILLNRPLSKAMLRTDLALIGLSILRYQRGTVFPVTPQEWMAIETWLEDDDTSAI